MDRHSYKHWRATGEHSVPPLELVLAELKGQRPVTMPVRETAGRGGARPANP